MIIHLVFVRIKPELDQETAKREIADALKGVPCTLKPIQLGSPISEERTKGFNFGLVAYFKDQAALDTYASSSEHITAVEQVIKPRIADFMDYDLEVPDDAPV